MRSRSECLDLARECEHKAAGAASPSLKALFKEIARGWRKLGGYESEQYYANCNGEAIRQDE